MILGETGTATLYAKWKSNYVPAPSSPTITIPASSDEGSVDASAAIAGTQATISVADSQIEKIVSDNDTTGTVKVDLTSIKVGIPYTLKAGEDPDDLTVWYIAEDGRTPHIPQGGERYHCRRHRCGEPRSRETAEKAGEALLLIDGQGTSLTADEKTAILDSGAVWIPGGDSAVSAASQSGDHQDLMTVTTFHPPSNVYLTLSMVFLTI